MVGKLAAALASLGIMIGADDLSRIARDLRAPRRLWIGSSIELSGNGQHFKLDTDLKSSGWFWARQNSLTTSIKYEPAGILDALEVYVAFDRNGDGRIEKSEWQLAGRDEARDAEGKSTATVRGAPLASGNVGWRIVQLYRDDKPFWDEWLDDGLTSEDR
jgi:hypothetical protein